MRTAQCRSCHAPIVWTTVRTSGRGMPVDATPSPAGTIALDASGPSAYAEVLSAPAAAARRDAGEELYASHFTTCPDARTWRRDR